MRVEVQVRSSYGLDRIYPMNAEAKLFARLAGRKTLLQTDLTVIKELGFVIEFIPQIVGE